MANEPLEVRAARVEPCPVMLSVYPLVRKEILIVNRPTKLMLLLLQLNSLVILIQSAEFKINFKSWRAASNDFEDFFQKPEAKVSKEEREVHTSGDKDMIGLKVWCVGFETYHCPIQVTDDIPDSALKLSFHNFSVCFWNIKVKAAGGLVIPIEHMCKDTMPARLGILGRSFKLRLPHKLKLLMSLSLFAIFVIDSRKEDRLETHSSE